MKKILLSITAFSALSVLALPLIAREYKLPKEESVFSISFPDKWTVTYAEESVDAVSPDEAVEIYVQVDDAETIEDSVKESIQYLEEQGVKLDVATQKETDGEQNGMKLASIGWKGTDKDGPCSVSLVFIQVTEDAAISLVYWASDEMVKKHEKELNAVMESIKSLATKKGKEEKKTKDEAEEPKEEK